MAAAGEQNGVGRGEAETTSSVEVAAFAAIVMLSFTVVYFLLQSSAEGNEDVLSLSWVFGKQGLKGKGGGI